MAGNPPKYFFRRSLCLLFLLATQNVVLSESTESTPGCGKIDQALVGKDPRVSAPWTATILYQSAFKCGEFRHAPFGHGVIIGPTTILMSASFLWDSKGTIANLTPFNPSNFIIAVGLKSRQPFQSDIYTQFLKISYIRMHPKSYDKYSENDFILIHLRNPIRFSSYVRPICLENSPDLTLENVNSTYKLGDLSISGYYRGHAALEPFGLLDSSICKSKLESEYNETLQAPELLKSESPCGFSSKSREDVQSWSGYGNGLIQARFMDFVQMAKLRPQPIVPNLCYQKGSSIVTFYNGRWHLVGITAESLGASCSNNLYFVSFVSYKHNLDWILQNVWFSTNSFVCDSGQAIELSRSCNDFKDCEDESDENEKYCLAIKCGTIFSSYCTKCDEKDSFQILGKTYNYSMSNSSEEVKCSALKTPPGSLLHCENPIIRKRITCEYGSDPGTKAIFQCKTLKPNDPASYCVITCKDDGTWTDELKTYKCQGVPVNTLPQNPGGSLPSQSQDNIFPSKNSTDLNWIDKILINQPDPSLDNWTPPPISDRIRAGKCPGFRMKPGLRIKCRSPNPSEGSSCSSTSVIPGTKAEFSCERYYRPIFSTASVIKTCQPNGLWSLQNRAFECRLDCGIPKQNLVGHIVNGAIASGTKWPWHGILFRKAKDGKLTYICGATLISQRLLLTAAHCVVDRKGEALTPDNFALILGASSNVLEENYGDPNSQILQIDNITVNPAFNSATFESDIAIIRVATPANITDFVRPSCFPSTITVHNELLHLSPGSNGYIIGFGYDESGTPSTKMKEARLPVVSYPECYQVLKIQASSTMFCAGFTNGTAACNGDSGGGMFFSDDTYPGGRMYMQGIVSHGNRDDKTGLCDKNQYSIFTKVASFKNWINEVGLDLDEDF